MTVVYCLLACVAGFVFGIVAISLAVMSADRKKRDEDKSNHTV